MAKKTKEAPAPQSLRAQMIAASSKRSARLHNDPEFGPMVFVAPGFKSSLALDEMDKLGRLSFLLLNCLHEAQIGEDDTPLIGKNGEPLIGPRVFEPSDKEWLETTDHPLDGWIVRVVSALNDFVVDTAAKAGVGKGSASG